MEKCSVKIFESNIKIFLFHQVFLIFFQPQFLHPILQLLGRDGQLLGRGVEPAGLPERLPDDDGLILGQKGLQVYVSPTAPLLDLRKG